MVSKRIKINAVLVCLETKGTGHLQSTGKNPKVQASTSEAAGKQASLSLLTGMALVEGKSGNSHQNERYLPLTQQAHFGGSIPDTPALGRMTTNKRPH